MATFLRGGLINIEEKLMMLGHKKLVHVGAMGQKLYHYNNFTIIYEQPLPHSFRICKVHPLDNTYW